MRTQTYTLALASTLIMTSPLAAQEAPEGFSAGLALGQSSSIFVDEDDGFAVLPLVRFESPRVSIGLPDGVRVTALSNQGLRVSGVLSPRLTPLLDSESDALDGIERDVTLDGGALLEYSVGRGTQFQVRAVTELTDEHGGQEVSAVVRQGIPIGRQPVLISAGLTWQSEDLAEYSYGVFEDEAIAGRPAYAPGDVVIPHIALTTFFSVSDNVSLIGSVRADFLPEEVTDSPIVDEDVEIGVLLGASYRF